MRASLSCKTPCFCERERQGGYRTPLAGKACKSGQGVQARATEWPRWTLETSRLEPLQALVFEQ